MPDRPSASPLPDRWPGAGTLLWPLLTAARRLSSRQLITRAVFLLLGLGLAGLTYGISAWFLELCYQIEVVGPLICQRLLDIVLLVLLSVLLLSNIVTALSTFFLAADLELLALTPVHPRPFFAARFGLQLLQSSWMVLAFGLPVLLAFAQVAGTTTSYLAVAVTLPPLLVFPAAAGVSLTLLLGSLLPAARLRNVVVALFLLGFLVLYIAVRLMQPEKLLNPEGFASVVYLLSSLSGPSGPWLPSSWATSVIVASFRGFPADPGWPLFLGLLVSGSGTAYVLTSLVFRRLHSSALAYSQQGRNVARLARFWARLRGRPLPPDGAIRTPGRRAPGVDWARFFARALPAGPYREMIVKDSKLLLRDASQWSQLLLLLALVFVYLYNFRHFRQLEESGLVGQLALYLLGLGLSGFVTAAVSVRFAFPVISLEGRLLWLLRTAPLTPRQLLFSKLISVLPPLLLVAEVMSVASCWILQVEPALLLLGVAVTGVTALAVGCLSIGVGAILPDFSADSAAKVATSFGSLVCMILAIAVALLLVVCAIYPAYWLQSGFVLRPTRLALSLVGGGVISLLAIVLPLVLGVRAIARLHA